MSANLFCYDILKLFEIDEMNQKMYVNFEGQQEYVKSIHIFSLSYLPKNFGESWNLLFSVYRRKIVCKQILLDFHFPHPPETENCF